MTVNSGPLVFMPLFPIRALVCVCGKYFADSLFKPLNCILFTLKHFIWQTAGNIMSSAHLSSKLWTVIPNTHRRRRRDSTVELSCVGVASTSAVCIEFATSSWRLPTTADENLETEHVERIYPVELSRVELCRRCVRARRLSWPSLQFCSVYVTVAENWKLGHDQRHSK